MAELKEMKIKLKELKKEKDELVKEYLNAWDDYSINEDEVKKYYIEKLGNAAYVELKEPSGIMVGRYFNEDVIEEEHKKILNQKLKHFKNLCKKSDKKAIQVKKLEREIKAARDLEVYGITSQQRSWYNSLKSHIAEKKRLEKEYKEKIAYKEELIKNYLDKLKDVDLNALGGY